MTKPISETHIIRLLVVAVVILSLVAGYLAVELEVERNSSQSFHTQGLQP